MQNKRKKLSLNSFNQSVRLLQKRKKTNREKSFVWSKIKGTKKLPVAISFSFLPHSQTYWSGKVNPAPLSSLSLPSEVRGGRPRLERRSLIYKIIKKCGTFSYSNHRTRKKGRKKFPILLQAEIISFFFWVIARQKWVNHQEMMNRRTTKPVSTPSATGWSGLIPGFGQEFDVFRRRVTFQKGVR